jgi:hypothetical protein
MASLIPSSVKKEITEAWRIEAGWKLMLLNHNALSILTAALVTIDQVLPATYEITDSGSKYPAGGVPMTGKLSTANGVDYFLDADNVIIGTGASITYRFGVIYQDTSSPSTSKIRAIIDFGAVDQAVVNGTSTIVWNALGIIYVS